MHSFRTASKGGVFAVLVAAIMLAFATTSASAAFVHLKASESTVRKDCFATGGTFSSSSKGYACQKGPNEVSCDNHGNCEGFCSKCSDTRTEIKGILRGPDIGAKATGGGALTTNLPGSALGDGKPAIASPSFQHKPLIRLKRQ